MKNSNKPSFLQKGSVAKRLALLTMFGVGFVLPTVNNIALANYGAYSAGVIKADGATGLLTGCNNAGATQSLTISDFSTSSNNAYWAKNKTTTYGGNYVVLTGTDNQKYTFKVVEYSSSNSTSGMVTLWNYGWNSTAGTGSVNGRFQTTTFGDGNATYSTSKLREFMTGSVASILSNYTGAMVAYTASGAAEGESKNGTAANGDLIWAPSTSEVKGTNAGSAGMWGLSGDIQRADGDLAWLRSYGTTGYAYFVRGSGKIDDHIVYLLDDYSGRVRPALQLKIESCNPIAFTSNGPLVTTGVLKDNPDSGTLTEYALDTGNVTSPTMGTSVTLDHVTISGFASGGSYNLAGMLTTDTTNDTWAGLSTKITYMDQASDGALSFSNVDFGSDEYVLRIFGLDGTNKKVTEVSSGAIAGLSKGSGGNLHIKVSNSLNAGVPITVSNGAVVDFGGGDLTAKLDLKTGGNLVVIGQLNFGTNGVVEQASDSNVIVDAFKIEADTNDPAKAMFTGVNSIADLNVASGNLTINGKVTDGKYYVLVVGDVVTNEDLTSADLWKKENIDLDLSKYIAGGYLFADYNYVTNGNAIAIKVQAATVEEVNTSGLAAVQQGSISVAKGVTDEVENRLSFVYRPSLELENKLKVRDVANTAKDDYKVETVEQGNANEVMPVQVAEKDKYDKEVWASYIRTKETTEGMKLGAGLEGNNTAQYNGAVVGVDFYTSKKAIAGMALSYVDGNINSHSGDTSTKNDAKYYAVSFYDRVTNGNTALIYDIGYIRGDNDINQFYTGQETTADVKTDTYTAGVRYEAELGTKKSRVVPFASFRYMRQNNKDYTNSHNTRFETKNQNLYIPKVGIAWTGDFAMPQCEWTWRPSVEVGYIWNLGDRSANSNVLVGTRISDIGYDVADKSSYYAKAGMEFMCKNFTAGLSYRYLKGDAVRNNKWNVNVAWSF